MSIVLDLQSQTEPLPQLSVQTFYSLIKKVKQMHAKIK